MGAAQHGRQPTAAALAAHPLGIRKNTHRGNGKCPKINERVPEHAVCSPARKTMAGMGRAEEESAAGHCNWRKYPINVASGRGQSKAARMGRKKKSHKNIGWEATQAEYGTAGKHQEP